MSARALPADPAALMHSILKRIATGPELSKDISREEACAGMRLVLDDPAEQNLRTYPVRVDGDDILICLT